MSLAPMVTPPGSRPGAAPALPLAGLLALFTAAFTAVLTELLPAGLLPHISAGLEVSEGRAGFLVTAYAAASFLAAIPLTALLRGLPRRRVLLGALAGFAVANVVTAVSVVYAVTFAARLLAGVAGGVLWAMLAGYAARMSPPERRGRAIAIVLAGITVALAFGVPAGSVLASFVGWRGSFGVLAGVAVVLMVWVWWWVPAFPGEAKAVRVSLRGVVRRPGVVAVLSVTLFLLPGHQVVYTYLAPVAGPAGVVAGVLLLVFGVATVLGVWVVGVVVDRGLRSALLGALGVVVAVMVVLGVFGRWPVVVVAAVALWGVAYGGVPTLLQTALVDAAGSDGADVATSMQATVFNAGIAAGTLLGGVLLDGVGAEVLPWVAVPLLVVSVVAASRIGRSASRGRTSSRR